MKRKVDTSQWNFSVDYNDHFETPLIAYKDLSALLNEVAAILSKPTQELVVYDPYWCQGSTIANLNSLGFNNIINRNRDFYRDIECNDIPGSSNPY